jgi:pyruvate formate lyase activating enzyme
MAPGEKGFCGIRTNRSGSLGFRSPKGRALAHMYLDPLPTNCCSAWFCGGSELRGFNLAVFFYGCGFDCLFCQNASHKAVEAAPTASEDDMVAAALDKEVRCVCFFGGSPEPQLAFALEVSERIIEESGNTKRICWEWNGCGDTEPVAKAAELSRKSGGTIKFDLKASTRSLGFALCGVDTARSFENFASLARSFPQRNLLTATTLLVPFYIDRREVGEIASFIGGLNPAVPYSLLVFHPAYKLRDLPVTPRAQVEECYREARRHLDRVEIGNRQLLGSLP